MAELQTQEAGTIDERAGEPGNLAIRPDTPWVPGAAAVPAEAAPLVLDWVEDHCL